MTPDLFWRISPLFKGKAVAVIGTGFSLTQDHLTAVRTAGLRMVAVNNAYEWAHDADLLYACDARWWRHYRCHGALGGPGNIDFKGFKVSLEETLFPDVHRVGNGGSFGFDPRPDYVRTGKNSAAQAVHVAIHAGAKLILLLGCDCRFVPGQPTHFFGEHSWRKNKLPSPYTDFLEGWRQFSAALPPGVRIINCTPSSAIDVFEKTNLERALNAFNQ